MTHGNELDRFLPRPDVRERHETLVKAPAAVVFDVAMHFDLLSLFPVRAIFWLREKVLGATSRPRTPQGIVAETMGLGWGILSHRQGRTLVMGAATRPWEADVTFRRIPAEQFTEFAEPDLVKICWTLEADPLGGALTRFATETRVAATDEGSRRKFLRYWRWAGFGIVAIRWLLLPAIRRAAERRFREGAGYIRRRVLG
jgi:hypothetical protein